MTRDRKKKEIRGKLGRIETESEREREGKTEGTERTEETETVWQTDGRVRKGTLQCQQGDHEVEIEVCMCVCV